MRRPSASILPSSARSTSRRRTWSDFPALRIAREALAAGGSASTVLNAANEVAVQAFLAKRIGFLAIAALVEATLAANAG